MKTNASSWLILATVAITGCDTTGPNRFALGADASHTRITTPGQVTFTVRSPTPLARLEVYDGARKVAETTGPFDPPVVSVTVTSADNGAHSYAVKGITDGGDVGMSAPISVEVDIRWVDFRTLEGSPIGGIVWDATGAVYSVYHTPTPDISVLVKRHGADGKQLWERIFGGSDWEMSASYGVDPAGRMYTAGTISYMPTGAHSSDCFLALYDATGSVVWTRLIASPASEQGCVAASDAAGNFHVAGNVLSESGPSLLTAKFSPDGTLIWQREHVSAGGVQTIAVDPLGGVYVGGHTHLSPDGAHGRALVDAFLLKFDQNGNQLWAKQYSTPDEDVVLDLAPDPEGGVYMTGYSDPIPGYHHPQVDAFIVRYASDGSVVWQRELDGGDRDHASAVAANSGGVYVLGATYSGARTGEISEPGQGALDVFLAKLDRGNGTVKWVRMLGSAENDTPRTRDLVLGPNGDVTIAAQVGGGLPGSPGIAIVLATHRESRP